MRRTRHAILILAHEDMFALKQLVAYFCKDCDIYIHIDKKSIISRSVLSELTNMNGVRYVDQKYKINWGSYNMLLAELHLLSIAYAEQRAAYYHLFSGQDYPLRPLWYFLDFFKNGKGINYIDCRLAESKYIYDRLLQYHLYGWFNAKRNKGKNIIEKTVRLQRHFGVFRSVKHIPRIIAVGSQWFSITNETVSAILNASKDEKNFLERLKYTFAPEELYINTLVAKNIMDKHICFDNLRYIRWKYENGNCPSILDISHLKYCISSKALFARKFDAKYSSELKMFIDANIINAPFPTIFNKRNFNHYEKFFNYDFGIAQTIKTLVTELEIKDVLYVECGSCLYLDSFIGLKMPVQGISSYEISDNYASAYNLLDFYQHIDIKDKTEANDTFDLILFINGSIYKGLYNNDVTIQNIQKLAKKYVLIIEDKENVEDINVLNSFVGAIVCCGFRYNKLSKTIFGANLNSKVISFFLEK